MMLLSSTTAAARAADYFACDATFTRLGEAAAAGDVLCVAALIHDGADVDLVDDHGRTPLFVAALNQRVEVIEQLLAAGAVADPHAGAILGFEADVLRALAVEPEVAKKQVDRWSIFELACRFGSIGVVKALLANGANPNRAGPRLTPMHLAAEGGQEEVLRLLLAAGGSPAGSQNACGFTPMHYAARSNAVGAVRLLLNAGADPNAKTSDGQTALAWAIEHDAEDVVSVLFNTTTDLDSSMLAATRCNRAELLGLMVNRARSPDIMIHNRFTLLHVGATLGHTEVIEVLLRAGANPNLPDADGVLPIDCARSASQADAVAAFERWARRANTTRSPGH